MSPDDDSHGASAARREGGTDAAAATPIRRRDWLARAATWGAGILSALVGAVPVLRALAGSSALDTLQGPEGFLAIGPLESLGDAPKEVELSGQSRDGWLREETDLGSVFVQRLGQGVRVFSSICPHLGCAVDYDPDGRRFLCPCHGSVFAADGRVLSGPSPRPLDELPSRVGADGEASCRWLRFAPGTPRHEVL